MDSSFIGKIEKGKRYAQETDRVHVASLRVNFHGEHSEHQVEYNEGAWMCDCNSFQHRGLCPHVIALETIFTGYLMPAPLATPPIEEPVVV